jgi:hypothetical protein
VEQGTKEVTEGVLVGGVVDGGLVVGGVVEGDVVGDVVDSVVLLRLLAYERCES